MFDLQLGSEAMPGLVWSVAAAIAALYVVTLWWLYEPPRG